MAQNADIQISALKMFADNRYADIEKKCRYADIADINIGTSLGISAKIVTVHCLGKTDCRPRDLAFIVQGHRGPGPMQENPEDKHDQATSF